MTQGQLATRTGLTRSYISRVETGAYQSVKQDVLEKIAKAFSMSVAELTQAIYGKVTQQSVETPEQILKRLELAQPISVPLYKDYAFHAGSPVEPMEYVYLSRTRAAGKNVQAYPVKGTCLEPDIKEGNIIFVDRDGQIDIGDIVACVINGDLHIGRLKKVAGELYLQNNYGQHKFKDCVMAAPVIEVSNRLK